MIGVPTTSSASGPSRWPALGAGALVWLALAWSAFAATALVGCNSATGPAGGHGWTLATGRTDPAAQADASPWAADDASSADISTNDGGSTPDAATASAGDASSGDAVTNAPIVPPAAYAGLVINEVDNKGTPEDWFELYNGRTEAIDLTGVRTIDKLQDDPAAAVFPPGTRLEPGAFLVVPCTMATVGYKLSAPEQLSLLAPDGQLIDQVTWQDKTDGDAALARVPDGGDSWHVVTGSPGKPNPTSP